MPEFLIPVLVVAVPALMTALYQWAKKKWLPFLDKLSAPVQQFVVATGTALVSAIAAHFGADLTGVEVVSPEALTTIVLQIFATFGFYNVAVQPAAERREE